MNLAGAIRILRTFRNVIRSLPYRGSGRTCPVCLTSFRCFRTFGLENRPDAQCPRCGALERHRLVWLFLERKTNLFQDDALRVLHVAPEACYGSSIQKRVGKNYVTADLMSSQVMVRMDITDIQYPDQSFDVIYCSHVLEHVDDDRKAMSEFHRVLADDGWAMLLVPVVREQTYEDPKITEPADREKAFGQTDHVRAYGKDYPDRLREAGFTVEVFHASDVATGEEQLRFGLTPVCGEVYFCTKSGDDSIEGTR